MKTIDHWIGGSCRQGTSGRFGDVYDPATGQIQAKVRLAGRDDVDAAVATASAAFATWSQTSLSARTQILFEFRHLVRAHKQLLAEMISDEHGKVVSDAAGEVQRGIEVIEFACGIPTLLKGEYSDQASTGVDVFSFREPHRCRSRHHPVQLPRHGAHVDVPGRDRLREHLRPQTQ